MNEQITLQEITEDTLKSILDLKVAKDQERFVAPNAVSIAQAHFSHEAWFRAIYAGDAPVGFVMLSLKPKKPEYFLWRLMIDEQFQHKGYGRAAMEQVVEFVRSLPNATELFTSYVPDNSQARDFYRELGFEETGLEEDGETVVRLSLE
jgi:diamine N-acetyltransferase